MTNITLTETDLRQIVDQISQLGSRVSQLESVEQPRPQLIFSGPWVIPVIPTGTVAFISVAVAGAIVSDIVVATHDTFGAADWLISAHVEAAGLVRVIAMNQSGGPLGAAGNVNVIVFK